MNAIINAMLAGLGVLVSHLLWMSFQGTLLAILIYVVTKLWKTGPACFKYGLWCLLIAKLLLPVSFSLPIGAVNLLPDTLPTSQAMAPWAIDTGRNVIAPLPGDKALDKAPRLSIHWTWAGCLGAIWLTGFAFVMTVIIFRYRRLNRLLLRSGIETPHRILEKFKKLSSLIDLHRPVSVLFSESVDTPLVIGILKPRIILPGGLFLSLVEKEQDGLILHELVHVKRWDHFVIVLEWIACAAHFFNPVAWWSVRRLRTERERACDDRVITLLEDGASDYGSGLIKVVQYQRQNAAGSAIGEALSLSERGSEIGRRIRRILDPVNQHRMAQLTLPSILALLLISCIFMPGKSGISTRSQESLNSRLPGAVWSGNIEELERLIAKGADINQKGLGQPLLTSALIHTHENKSQILTLLLDHKANPNEKDKNGNTPLVGAFPYWTPSPQILDLFLKYGANINQANSRGETLLELSINYPVSDLKFIQSLLQKGADPNIQNYRGETALHLAVRPGPSQTKEIVDLLLAHGAKVNIRDKANQIALNYAAGCTPEIMVALVNAGSDLTVPDRMQETPLLMAARWNNMAAVRLMIAKGADVHAKDKWGTTALFKVASAGDLEVVKALVERGADVNKTNQGGYTPLHFAVAGDRKNVADFLISKGALVNARNKDGLTPLEYAKVYKSLNNPKTPATNKTASIQKKREISVEGEVIAYQESDIPENLKFSAKQDGALSSAAVQSLMANPKTRLVLRPRMMIGDQQDGNFVLGDAQHPALRFAVLPRIQPDGRIKTQVEIDLRSMRAPFDRTDSLKQTRLIRPSSDESQIFGPLKQDGQLVFTLLKLEVIPK